MTHMHTMQSFHAWLSGAHDTAPRDAQQARLLRLTQVSPEQMAVLKADLDWESWGTVEPAPAAAFTPAA
jgi:hypothetical protein